MSPAVQLTIGGLVLCFIATIAHCFVTPERGSIGRLMVLGVLFIGITLIFSATLVGIMTVWTTQYIQ